MTEFSKWNRPSHCLVSFCEQWKNSGKKNKKNNKETEYVISRYKKRESSEKRIEFLVLFEKVFSAAENILIQSWH